MEFRRPRSFSATQEQATVRSETESAPLVSAPLRDSAGLTLILLGIQRNSGPISDGAGGVAVESTTARPPASAWPSHRSRRRSCYPVRRLLDQGAPHAPSQPYQRHTGRRALSIVAGSVQGAATASAAPLLRFPCNALLGVILLAYQLRALTGLPYQHAAKSARGS